MTRRWTAGCTVLALLSSVPVAAAPDPTIAGALGVASTVVPAGLTALLWSQGRGSGEGIRFDVGLLSLGLGLILGPSIGQFYAEHVGDGVITALLRGLTGSVLLAGLGFRVRGADDNRELGNALIAVGGVPTGILVLYDWFTAPSNARQAGYREGHSAVPFFPVPAPRPIDLARALVLRPNP